MDRSEMIALLQEHQCRVIFKKADGQERDMICTLAEEFLPKQVDLEEAIQKKAANQMVIAVWDLDKQAWRSFRVDSIISFSYK